MISPNVLKSCGYTDEKLKAKIKNPKPEKKVKDFLEMTEARIRDGLLMSWGDAATYKAIDEALQVPKNQLVYTMVDRLVETRTDQKSVRAIIESTGVGSMYCPEIDPETKLPRINAEGKPVYKLDLPVFRQVFLPLVLSYAKARWALLFNAWDAFPFMKYEPSVPTRQDLLACRIITGRVERLNADMGIRDVWRQIIWQALVYSRALFLPREPWFREAVIESGGNGEKKKKKIVKEGPRLDVPHPTRTFRDASYPAYTINTDTGCAYYGEWDIFRWVELRQRKDLWIDYNDDQDPVLQIPSAGKSIWWGTGWRDLSILYPCAMSVPGMPRAGSVDDRMTQAFAYNSSNMDQGVPLVNMYQKVVPSQFDLFDYDEPLWLRVVSATETVPLKVEPMLYTPGGIGCYDEDFNRAVGNSLAMEIMPFADQVTMMFGALIGAIRRNLNSIVFYDQLSIKQGAIDEMRAASSRTQGGMHFVAADFEAMKFAGQSPGSIFAPIALPLIPTSEAMNGIMTTLQLLERVLGFSAQEVGTTAAHAQSATEVTAVAQYMKERAVFTGSHFDTAMTALKRICYEAWVGHGDDEISIEGVELSEGDIATLTMLGFEGIDGKPGLYSSKTKPRPINAIASTKEGARRTNDTMIAREMLQIFQTIFSNPAIVEQVGMEKVMDWFNTIAVYAGLPEDMRLSPKGGQSFSPGDPSQPPQLGSGGPPGAGGGPGGPPQPGGPGGPGGAEQQMTPELVAQAIQQSIAQSSQETMQAVQQMIQESVGGLAQAVQTETEQNHQSDQQLAQGIEALKQEITQALGALVNRISKIEGATNIHPGQPIGPTPIPPPTA